MSVIIPGADKFTWNDLWTPVAPRRRSLTDFSRIVLDTITQDLRTASELLASADLDLSDIDLIYSLVGASSGEVREALAFRVLEPHWKKLHRIADGAVPEFETEAQHAFRLGKSKVSKASIIQMLARGRLNVDTAIEATAQAMERSYRGPIANLLSDAATVTAKKIPGVRALGGVGSGNFGHAGRPGEVGGSATEFYHGTSTEIAEKILKDGLQPLSPTGYGPAAFASTSEDVAISYAATSSDDSVDRIAVIVFKSEAAEFFRGVGSADRRHTLGTTSGPKGSWLSMRGTEVSSSETIPPSMIKEIRFYRMADALQTFGGGYKQWGMKENIPIPDSVFRASAAGGDEFFLALGVRSGEHKAVTLPDPMRSRLLIGADEQRAVAGFTDEEGFAVKVKRDLSVGIGLSVRSVSDVGDHETSIAQLEPRTLGEHTGLLVALWLDPVTAKRLAVPGGEPYDDLHITLAYVKDADFDDAVEAVRSVPFPPLHGAIVGADEFTASDASDGLVPIWLRPVVPGLTEYREKIVEALRKAGIEPSTKFEYVPHICVGYVEDGDQQEFYAQIPDYSYKGVPIAFDAVTVIKGSRSEDISLRAAKFNPDQPRDDDGQWTGGTVTARGPHIGLIAPDGKYHIASGEDHTDLARRLLKLDEGGVKQALDAGYVRYWVRRNEIAINMQAGHPNTASSARQLLKEFHEPGMSIYMDIEPMRGLMPGKPVVLDVPHFFNNVREANALLHEVGRWTPEAQRARLKAAGGAGSGNFDHAGRPGEVGGSAPDGEDARLNAEADLGIAAIEALIPSALEHADFSSTTDDDSDVSWDDLDESVKDDAQQKFETQAYENGVDVDTSDLDDEIVKDLRKDNDDIISEAEKKLADDLKEEFPDEHPQLPGLEEKRFRRIDVNTLEVGDDDGDGAELVNDQESKVYTGGGDISNIGERAKSHDPGWQKSDSGEGEDHAIRFTDGTPLTKAEALVVKHAWEEHYEAAFVKAKEKAFESDDYYERRNELEQEAISSEWHNMSDSDKMQYVNTDNIRTRSVSRGLPHTWTVDTEDGDSTDYGRTGAMARQLVTERTAQLLAERGSGTDRSPSVALSLARQQANIWDEWKSDSQSDGGQALQLATARELGGVHRFAKDDELRIENNWGADNVRYLQAYARAQWEVTQYVAKKAGYDDFILYRGLMLPKSAVEAAKKQDVSNDRFTGVKLPDLSIKRGGAQSATLARSVANGWGGIHSNRDKEERVVVRFKVPRTSVLSLPVFGQNVHGEKEVVIAGTKNRWTWDAWRDKAPLPDQHPFGGLN